MSTYYLSSMDSSLLEPVRACQFIGVKRFTTGKECVLAKIAPGIQGGQLGITDELSEVWLSARHEGVSLTKILEFPCFVHVAMALRPELDKEPRISASDLASFAWGELYRSRSDAENHLFD